MRRFVRSPWIILGLCLAVLVLAAAVVYAYQCNYYSDTTVLYDPLYGEHCGGSGGGCTECWDTGTAESCVESGFTNCFAEENPGVI